ncbi:enoyl-CoA hydratase/isomerase family protein [soil metagenome]
MPQTNFVPVSSFDYYKEQFKEHAILSRESGVIEVRFHTLGADAAWSYELHRSLPQLFAAIGADRENECVILTGTGDNWLKGADLESFANVEGDPETFRQSNYDFWYLDGTKLQESLLWNIDVPTISAINGPGIHTEFGLICDLTIAAEEAVFLDPHIFIGLVPGDGQYLTFQELLGTKRANYLMYINQAGITAAEALTLGMVNEVVPRENLLTRAHELADQIMRADRITRRMTTTLVRRPWKRRFTEDFSAHFSAEMFAANVSRQYFEGGGGESHF